MSATSSPANVADFRFHASGFDTDRHATTDVIPVVRKSLADAGFTEDALQVATKGHEQLLSADEKLTSWIEIERIDEDGQSRPGDTYAVKQPDGRFVRGALDALGLAHVAAPDPDLCEVTFPKLDSAAWEKTA